jgi:hypothetical protein
MFIAQGIPCLSVHTGQFLANFVLIAVNVYSGMAI